MDEIEALVGDTPDSSAYHAVTELHYGRLEWLAEHIRRSEYQISPLVAEKILAMIEKTDPNCFFELMATRKLGLAPRLVDPQLKLIRNLEMAILVARSGGFKRGHLMRACHVVGEQYGLMAEQVRREIKDHKEAALGIIKEEEMQAAYVRGEIDFLGRPKK